MKFEDRSQEETERQERCARGDAWRLDKNIFKVKETDKATFFSPTNERSLPAPSTTKLEEREFVVDSCASMHMWSRKDLNSAELETEEVSRNPTTVVTNRRRCDRVCQRNGFIHDSNASRRTPAVLSLGKLCEDHGYSHHWTSGQKPQLIIDGRRVKCNTANYVPIVVPGQSTGSSSSATTTAPTPLPQEAVTPWTSRNQKSSRMERTVA